MSKMIKCPNCGADIDETLSKCPYCGYINIEGAEDQYMDKLEDVRSKLDVVDDEARDEYKKGLFKPLKVIIIVSVIVFVIFCAGLLLSARIDKINKDSSTHTGEDTLAEMKWEKEHYALYDELLESGEYDELVETIYQDRNEGHTVHRWDHYNFYTYYVYCKETEETLEKVDKEGWNNYASTIVTYDCLYYIYMLDDEDTGLNDEDRERIVPCAEYMHTIFTDRLGYDDEQIDELKKRVLNEYGNMDYDKVKEVAEENQNKYK
ncbi:MAG: zinc ribbon domain-containing protein [Lachnospiraceae bacterium]|nr:zinc ribbon domain-containing protein [Lachnospiraceae bacterium]